MKKDFWGMNSFSTKDTGKAVWALGSAAVGVAATAWALKWLK